MRGSMEKKSGAVKVLKNTISLYIRTIFLTLISLFSFRIILQSLGEADYGLYDVVGGVISMFSFISGSLAISSQRFFAICLAKEDWKKLNKLFSVNLAIYMVLILAALFFAETLGLWFVQTQLKIDAGRKFAAVIVYELSILNFSLGLIVSPFLALLIADENLSIYSMVSVVEGILKVAVAYFLNVTKGDKLIVYALLLTATSFIVNGFYIAYVMKKYPKLKFKLCREKAEYAPVFSFLNWNLIGAVASILKNQGVKIIINMFFGSVVNGAKGVASHVSSTIASFSQNFMKAVEPRITKSYAGDDRNRYLSTIYTASKLSYFLLFIISLPFMMNIQYVMQLWLKKVPDNTIIFTILILADSLILSITDSILTGVQAIGRVRTYQLTVGILALLNLPVSVLMLNLVKNPIIPFCVSIGISMLMTAGRLLNLKRIYDFSIITYVKKVFVPILVVTAVGITGNQLLFAGASNFGRLVANVAGSLCITVPAIYLVGMDKQEKQVIKEYVRFRRKQSDV